jgi:hypothetical protein
MKSDSQSESRGVISSTECLGAPFRPKKQSIPLEPEGWVVVNMDGEEIAGLFEEKWEAWRWIAEEYFAAMTPNVELSHGGDKKLFR